MGLARKEKNAEKHQHTGSRPERKQDVYQYKYCYDNLLTALMVCDRMTRLHPEYRYTVYECEECEFIHIGRMPLNARFYFEGEEPVISPESEAACILTPKLTGRLVLPHTGPRPNYSVPKNEVPGLNKAPKDRPWEAVVKYSTERRGYTPFAVLKDFEVPKMVVPDVDPNLRKLLEDSLKQEMTPREKWLQRVSFAYGNLMHQSNISNEMIHDVATEVYGPCPEE